MKTPALNNRLSTAARPSRLPAPAIYLARLRSKLSQAKTIVIKAPRSLFAAKPSAPHPTESSAAE